jgi:DnaK suppressor protein
MSNDMIQKFKSLFENHLSAFSEKSKACLEVEEALPDEQADKMDLTTTRQALYLDVRLRDRDLKFVERIRSALRRIEDGSFGYCSECGDDIGIARLFARPTATLCSPCKDASECGERRRQPAVGRTPFIADYYWSSVIA